MLQDPYEFNAPMAPLSGIDPAIQQAAVAQQGVTTSASPLTTAAPAVDPVTGLAKPGFMQPGGMLSVGIGAVSTLGNLWNSFQQNKLAKQSLALQTRAFETNLGNQTKTYNTGLEDRMRARAAATGQSEREVQSYINKNKL